MSPLYDDGLNVNDEPIYDAWTGIDYKFATTRANSRGSRLAPDWMRPHRRRITAYDVLRAVLSNTARRWKEVSGRTADEISDSEYQRQQHREYGDAETIRDAIRDALLGDSTTIVVDGAEDFDPEFDPEAEPAEDAEPEAVETERQRQAEARRAFEVQEWLQAWEADERFPAKIVETESDAVGLGDGVYSFGWNVAKRRVRMRCWDPSAYFPVLTDDLDADDFPEKVHIAWEFEDELEANKHYIRRITWQLGPIMPRTDENGDPILEENGPVLRDGDRFDSEGRISRTYAYATEPSTVTCYLTDATWSLKDTQNPRVDDLDPEKAVYATAIDGELIRRRDIGMDFIPVVHVPNTVAEKEHFGKSSVTLILQILDDLAGADTELAAASKTVAIPPIAISGVGTAGTEDMTYRSGAVWDLGQKGRLDSLDTSRALDALLKYAESLLKRLSVNGRVPEEWLGRLKESGEPPSGISRRLGFGPLERMVRQMRLVRDEKYPLILKFVWRIAVANGDDAAPKEFVPARVAFGSFIPADLAAVAEMVSKLRTTDPPSISLETAVGLLIEAGLSIDDAVEEVRRIEARDFEGANQLIDATGRVELAEDYLGVPAAAGSIPPEPPIPTLPGDET